LINSGIEIEPSVTEETTAASPTPKPYNVEPNEEIQDTLEQVSAEFG
jgi:hypothetical protein